MNKQHYKSLNSQLNVVVNGIIYFSVRICDNSLLVLKMCFQVFSFVNKKVQAFSSDRKILMSLLPVFFHIQTVSQFFKFLVFNQDNWGNVHYVPEISFIS